MLTANEILQHEAISHSVDFSSYNNGVVRRIMALLNRTTGDMLAQISAALEQLPAESFTVERLESLLYSVRATNKAAYDAVSKELTAELRDLVTYEAGYQQQLFASVLPVQVNVASVVVEQVYSAAVSRPMQSRLLSEWSAGIEADRMVRVRDALRLGYVEGQTISQMVARIRGTRARGYSDGLLEIDRRNCSAVVRTATAHMASFTRQRFYEDNSSLIVGERFCATLDFRTTTRCASLDSNVFKPGQGPQPPLHWNCRSVRVPILRSWRSMGIDLDELPESTRASLSGQVPESLSYQQWLEKQSAARQDEVLGVTKGKLFRNGGMPLTKFIDRSGRELTLDQLRERDAVAFKRAGL